MAVSGKHYAALKGPSTSAHRGIAATKTPCCALICKEDLAKKRRFWRVVARADASAQEKKRNDDGEERDYGEEDRGHEICLLLGRLVESGNLGKFGA